MEMLVLARTVLQGMLWMIGAGLAVWAIAGFASQQANQGADGAGQDKSMGKLGAAGLFVAAGFMAGRIPLDWINI